MPSTYTGVAANVSLASAVTESLPLDGEAANVASVNAALQKLADYAEAMRAKIAGASAPKAWGYLTAGAAGAVAVTAGFNIASATYSTADMTVNFTTPLSNANYVVVFGLDGSNGAVLIVVTGARTTSSFTATKEFSSNGTASNWANTEKLTFAVFGA